MEFAAAKDRFFSKRRWVPSSGCIEWAGSGLPFGYGLFKFNGKMVRAHRFAWALEHGSTPSLHVLHRCDNPPCINHEHLFLGTQQDNMRDRDTKGRGKYRENHPSAKLSWDNVRLIRESTELTRVLAKKFGVCGRTIYEIRTGRNWKDLGA